MAKPLPKDLLQKKLHKKFELLILNLPIRSFSPITRSTPV